MKYRGLDEADTMELLDILAMTTAGALQREYEFAGIYNPGGPEQAILETRNRLKELITLSRCEKKTIDDSTIAVLRASLDDANEALETANDRIRDMTNEMAADAKHRANPITIDSHTVSRPDCEECGKPLSLAKMQESTMSKTNQAYYGHSCSAMAVVCSHCQMYIAFVHKAEE